ncbi:DUF2924 domain-containing protein [Roseovarius sp. 10]|uniref:DUF2924 domain-containing protein n=1 Tax=Roseovarius sp. 10 TaxID=3080563 RepID=UPI002954422A|nr:DUF2924 domain-containing protein [Roseovarius sp. 10]MDV7202425.1 DUF2924 domain-containing protein [Roseovarius sp. 10]
MTHQDPIPARIAALPHTPIEKLKEQWRDLFGDTPPPFSRANLEHRLAYRIQELAYGGLDPNTKRILNSLADEAEGLVRRKSLTEDPRNPVIGTTLVREWNGVAHHVTVQRSGYEWQGRTYRSLSGVARAISGTRWNGYRFFGLRSERGHQT